MNSINFGCPQCQKRAEVDASRAGSVFRCKTCYYEFPVPEKSTLRPEDIQDTYAELPEGVKARRAAVVAVCPICYTTIPGFDDEIGTRKPCPECGTRVEIRESDKKRVRIADGIPTMSTEGTDPHQTYVLSEKEVTPTEGVYENDFRRTHRSGRIPVVCPLCRTLTHAANHQLGTEIQCPECGRMVKVVMPENHEHTELRRRLTEIGTYREQEKDAGSASKESPRRDFTLSCNLCHTLLSVTRSQIGEEIPCPDCGTKNRVLPPVEIPRKTPETAISRKHLHAEIYTLDRRNPAADSVNAGETPENVLPYPPLPPPLPPPEPMLAVQCMLCGELQHIPRRMEEKLKAKEIACIDCGRPMNATCIIRNHKTKLAEETEAELNVPEPPPRNNPFVAKILSKAYQKYRQRPRRTTRESLDDYGVNAPVLMEEEIVHHEAARRDVISFFTAGILDVLAQPWILITGVILAGLFFLPAAFSSMIFAETPESAHANTSEIPAIFLLLGFAAALACWVMICFRILLRTASGFDPVINSAKQLTNFHFENLVILFAVSFVYLIIPGAIMLALAYALGTPFPAAIFPVISAAILFFPQMLRSLLLNGFSRTALEDLFPFPDHFPFRMRGTLIIFVIYSLIYILLHYGFVGDPFDGKVWRDVRDRWVYWSIFYVLSFLMAGIFLATLFSEFFFDFPVILGNVFLSFLYFRMLGRVWFYSDEMRESF